MARSSKTTGPPCRNRCATPMTRRLRRPTATKPVRSSVISASSSPPPGRTEYLAGHRSDCAQPTLSHHRPSLGQPPRTSVHYRGRDRNLAGPIVTRRVSEASETRRVSEASETRRVSEESETRRVSEESITRRVSEARCCPPRSRVGLQGCGSTWQGCDQGQHPFQNRSGTGAWGDDKLEK